MDRFLAMQAFVSVARHGSFSKAAQTLGWPRSSVTEQVQRLETHVGARLLHRNTRSLRLTEQGQVYYDHCVALFTDLDAVEAGLRESQVAVRGRVRINMPGALAQALVVPRLADFFHRYPEVKLSLTLHDGLVDIVGDGPDCVICTGKLEDSTLVARPLGLLQWIVCASPLYLNQHGAPATLEALAQHTVINYLSPNSGRPREWLFQADGGAVTRVSDSRLAVSETGAYLQCALEGLGLIQMSQVLARPYLASGRLREVLAPWRPTPIPVSALSPHGRQTPQAVRVFVDWLAELMAGAPSATPSAVAPGGAIAAAP